MWGPSRILATTEILKATDEINHSTENFPYVRALQILQRIKTPTKHELTLKNYITNDETIHYEVGCNKEWQLISTAWK